MWECGVATHAQIHDTKIMLVQCTRYSPALFADQVKVNARNRADVQRFVNDFMTNRDFFAGFDEPITRFQANSHEVVDAASELFERLQGELPPLEEEEPDEWPPCPYMRLDLSLHQVDRICTCVPERQGDLTKELLETEALVTYGDKEAARLFGMVSFPRGTRLRQLLARWKSKNPASEARWFDAISSQVTLAAQWQLPTMHWELMRGLDEQDSNWYAPALIQVRKVPARHCMEFEFCFLKFNRDESGKVTNIGMPDAGDADVL
jgi:hypothetical protein